MQLVSISKLLQYKTVSLSDDDDDFLLKLIFVTLVKSPEPIIETVGLL